MRRSKTSAPRQPHQLPAYRLKRQRQPCELYESPVYTSHPAAVARWLHLRFTDSPPTFGALLLDTHSRVVGHLFWPGIDFESFPAKDLFIPSLLASAVHVALCYGPLEKVELTAGQLRFAKRMEQAGEVIGIRVTDFLLLGRDAASFLSLRRELGLGRDSA